MKTFTPIAMRCTEEQFKAIEPKLKANGYEIFCCNDFINNPYLCMLRASRSINNYKAAAEREVYEEWNEEIFLNACGIEPTYTITKEQLTYLHSVDSIKETIEEWFPNEFSKLEIGKWYKEISNLDYKYKHRFLFVNKIKCEEVFGYGIDGYGEWFNNRNYNVSNFTLATEQEVSEALIAEAKKRGFKKGIKYKSRASGLIYIFNDELYYSVDTNKLTDGNICNIFKDGVWAEIISEPIEVTLEEIAKLKGCNVEQLRIKE